ncbi:hypothetical protein RCH05_002540 [Janthinobacterium sp. CAN_S7]
MHISTSRLGRPLACACLCAAVAQAALTAEVGGVKLGDTVPELAFYTALLKSGSVAIRLTPYCARICWATWPEQKRGRKKAGSRRRIIVQQFIAQARVDRARNSAALLGDTPSILPRVRCKARASRIC